MDITQIVYEIESNTKQRKVHESLRYAYEGQTYDLGDRRQRMALIDVVTRAYVLGAVKVDTALLERLTDAILDEELTDTHPDKVTNTEYPFMSDWQLDLRRDKETGLKAAEEIGTDGRDYRKPTKRRRTSYENWRVDRDAKGGNTERQAQYKRDTAASALTVYNVNETGGELTEQFVAAQNVAKAWRERLSSVYT
ncbi:hypothetical protein BBD42_15530 [Paenibacillus sp. BIHB 4019]|uniref:Uncharacterized protein n=1 Tax=Paenibacillus sp. BIHB 4019 TaxID=1870819 RepID=A0A1B2DJ28_9BACL|nr:hypothetical protein [Paenibacillus sp. BIHB 4019]ANY67718.1 hypothetical protein BBD42_15530 [Paenibacillus sp. BIHB 4019]